MPSIPVIVSVNADIGLLVKLNSELSGKVIFQLHGGEGIDYLNELIAAAPQIKIWQAVAVSAEKIPKPDNIHPATALALYDTGKKGVSGFGGTGSPFDWSILSKVEKPRFWGLAGGIDIHNIREARKLNPWLIDVASGSESKPGQKDHDKIKVLSNLAKGS